MKKIVVMPVKNEEWILEKSLACASLWADHIIVADQQSTDRTPDICRRFEKVVYIKNESQQFNEQERRQILLNAARNFDGENLIFALDADEIVTANILDGNDLTALMQQVKPGMSVQMQWIQLWKDVDHYNNSSLWSHNYKHFAYYDDRKMAFGSGAIHLTRVPEAAVEQSVISDKIKILHYQFVDWERMLAKQRFYRVLEQSLSETRNAFYINHRYFLTKEKPVLKKIVPEWINEYKKHNIDLEHFGKEDLYWQDIDVLKSFKKHGVAQFKLLDIWDVDWEKKRKFAMLNDVPGLPEETIHDPRNRIIKFYHTHIQPMIGYEGRPYKLYRFIKKWGKK